MPSAVDDQYVKDLESRIAEQKQIFEKEMADLRAENNAFENELLLRQQLMTVNHFCRYLRTFGQQVLT